LIINKISNDDIFYGFVSVFFYCKFFNDSIVLLKNVDCKNSEKLNNLLIISNNTEINKNWSFHYFIPSEVYNKNYLLLGYKNNIDDIIKILNPKMQIIDIKNILKILKTDINWSDENISDHSFKWCNNQIVSEFLDLICYGNTNLLPIHWNKPHFLEKNYLESNGDLWYYNVYLKSRNLEDNIENKIDFIINYKIK